LVSKETKRESVMPVILDKRLLDAKEAARYLSISRSKLYQWAERERIRSVRIDTRRLFDVNDLDAFIDSLKAEQDRGKLRV